MPFSEQNCRHNKKRKSYCPVESEIELSTGGWFFPLLTIINDRPLRFVAKCKQQEQGQQAGAGKKKSLENYHLRFENYHLVFLSSALECEVDDSARQNLRAKDQILILKSQMIILQ